MTEAPRNKGIYLLPNLFTTGALFSGYYAIVSAINGHFELAAIAVFVAGLLDGMDGRIARMTHTQSEFGVQYDSLSDLVSFGLAPSLVIYLWSLSAMRELGEMMGKIGWLAAFLYATCAALRLARFNTQAASADKRYFQGLASPAAAGALMAWVWFGESMALNPEALWWLSLPLTVVVALMMVSNFRYFSFKSWPVRERIPFLWLLPLVGVFVLLAANPPLVLLLISLLYLASGPVGTLLGRQRRRRRTGQRHEGREG